MPVRPVAEQRAMCTAAGEAATFDLYLLNDTDNAATGTLTFTAVSPTGKLIKLGDFPAPQWQRDTFSYLVKEAFVTPKLNEEGMWKFRFALSSAPASTHTREIWVTAAPAVKRARPVVVAVSGVTAHVRKDLDALGPRLGLTVREFKAGEKYDVIVVSGLAVGVSGTQNSGDTTGLEAQPAGDTGPTMATKQVGHIEPAILEVVKSGTPLLAIPQADTLSEGVARQLAEAGAFAYNGSVGDYRAPWMGNWYFVRKHPLYAGMPVDQAMGIHYQVPGREANGLLIEGANVEIVAAYSRDHDRRVGAGTFIAKLGSGRIVYQRVPSMHPVLQQRFLANAVQWLVS
jgi:hypothetical protein